MVRKAVRKAERATAAWSSLVLLMRALHSDHVGVGAELGLTPGESRALDALEPDDARPMGALAASLCCDASNVTWLVDRLEAHGYVERRPSATDRRVRAVALTAAGAEARDHLRRAHATPPDALLALSTDELETLSRLLGKAVAHIGAPEGLTPARNTLSPAAVRSLR